MSILSGSIVFVLFGLILGKEDYKAQAKLKPRISVWIQKKPKQKKTKLSELDFRSKCCSFLMYKTTG